MTTTRIMTTTTTTTTTNTTTGIWPIFGGSVQHLGRSNYSAFDVSDVAAWSYQTKGPVYSSPTIDKSGNVYFGSYDGTFNVVSRTGSLIWSYNSTYRFEGAAAIDDVDGACYAYGSLNFKSNALFSFDSFGSLKWRMKSPTLGQPSSPIVFNHIIYTTFGTNILNAIAPSGSLLWNASLPGLSVPTPSISHDGQIIYIIAGSTMLSYTITGSFIWSCTLSTLAVSYSFIMVSDENYLVVGTRSSGLFKVSPQGSILWNVLPDASFYATAAQAFDGTIYIASEFENRLYALEPTVGSIKWYFSGYDSNSAMDASATIDKYGNIYFGTDQLYCVNPSGSLLFTFLTHNQELTTTLFSSSSALGESNLLHVGSSDGRLYALSSTTPSTTLAPATRKPTLAPTRTPGNTSNNNSSSSTIVIAVAVAVPVAVVAVLVFLYCWYFQRLCLSSKTSTSAKGTLTTTTIKKHSHDRGSMHVELQETVNSDTETFFTSDVPALTWNLFSLQGQSMKESVIGQGTFGLVLSGFYSVNQRTIPVAVKIFIKSKFASNDEYRAVVSAAWEEANIMKNLENKSMSKSVARCYGVAHGVLPSSLSTVENEEAVGIVMRLERGGSLEKLLFPGEEKAKIPIGLASRLRLLLQISRGLAEMHSLGVVHGDVKPSNILLTQTNPPDIRFTDFGQTVLQEMSGSLSESTLQQTAHGKGTPKYSAPEMLINPFDPNHSETVARVSKKTDMYAFAVTAYEVLSREPSFAGIQSEITLSTKVHQGVRPDVVLLRRDFSPAVVDMIEACWSKDRSQRKHAIECYALLHHVYSVYEEGRFDIFFSHAWATKPLLSHVYCQLVQAGYRVWYDQHDMGFNMVESMKKGIENSRVVIVCINEIYQGRRNCMFELKEAVNSLDTKPVLILSTQSNIQDWANDELKALLKLNNSNNATTILNNIVDISSMVSAFNDDDNNNNSNNSNDISMRDDLNDSRSNEEQVQQLSVLLQPLFQQLLDKKCCPSLL